MGVVMGRVVRTRGDLVRSGLRFGYWRRLCCLNGWFGVCGGGKGGLLNSLDEVDDEMGMEVMGIMVCEEGMRVGEDSLMISIINWLRIRVLRLLHVVGWCGHLLTR